MVSLCGMVTLTPFDVQGPHPLDGIADILHQKGQVDAVLTQGCKGGILHQRTQGVADRIAQNAIHGCFSVNASHYAFPLCGTSCPSSRIMPLVPGDP